VGYKDKDLAKLSKLLGIDLPKNEQSVQAAREEEAVAAYVKLPKSFGKRQCAWCKRQFAANRRNVAYCGSKCRLADLRETYGIYKELNEPISDDDHRWVWRVWWGEEPLIVPPETLEALEGHPALNHDKLQTSQNGTTQEGIHITEDIGDILSDTESLLDGLDF
jgi:hypothetical protein